MTKEAFDKFRSDYGVLCERHGLVIDLGFVKPLAPGELNLYLSELRAFIEDEKVIPFEREVPVFEPEEDEPVVRPGRIGLGEEYREPPPVHRGRPMKKGH